MKERYCDFNGLEIAKTWRNQGKEKHHLCKLHKGCFVKTHFLNNLLISVFARKRRFFGQIRG
jgi:hypothetical protein